MGEQNIAGSLSASAETVTAVFTTAAQTVADTFTIAFDTIIAKANTLVNSLQMIGNGDFLGPVRQTFEEMQLMKK